MYNDAYTCRHINDFIFSLIFVKMKGDIQVVWKKIITKTKNHTLQYEVYFLLV